MREAVGGTWLLYFFLVFIFVYVVFIAVIMNYASAYRATNYVISELENTEGMADIETINTYVRQEFTYLEDTDICCMNVTNSISGEAIGTIFRVTNYISFEIPMLGTDLYIPIKEQSKTVYNTDCASIVAIPAC